jgi:BolA protein
MAGGGTRETIAAILETAFRPVRLEVRDESAAHAGHAGAAAGGGHFAVTIVSAAFEGKTLLEQHRMVNEALRRLIGREIHALALKTIPASVAEPS